MQRQAAFKVSILNDSSEEGWKRWTSRRGGPVPVKIAKEVWDELVQTTLSIHEPANNPRVFRLFMPRGEPRHVVAMKAIQQVWQTDRGIIRWKEEGYPGPEAKLRKGGNAFIRGNIKLKHDDAWWMGRELTDLRILLANESGKLMFTAWWVRGGTGKSGSTAETNGEVLPVQLIISDD